MPPLDRIAARVDRLELPFDTFGLDPYGVSKKHLTLAFAALEVFYRRYFSMKAHGLSNVPGRGRAMLIGNHSGGVAIDGAMIIAAMFLELEPPRLAQSMADKFINRIPVASTWASRTGQFTGLPEHAQRLLEDDRLLLIFPEGARGTAKLYGERNSLVSFGTGFMRLALKTQAPIIPFGFIGGGDALPTFANAYRLGQLLGLPYIPVTPYLVPLPLPAQLSVRFGAPLVFEGNGAEDDGVIAGYVEQVKSTIAALVAQGQGGSAR